VARLSTHVLDLVRGGPAAGVRIELFRVDGARREFVRGAVTNADGRTSEPLLECESLPLGEFELLFHAGDYFRGLGVKLSDPPFLDHVVIRFGIDPAAGSYHVPLLLAPHGYSTYRGS
jgi:5-hydroxyisourate hydrolase